jgi:GntR family transcriptional regulator/MocR family aminotransferase
VVERRARAAGLGLYSLSSGAAFDFNGSAADDSLMLGYSSLSEEEIDLAVEKLDAILGPRR